LKCKRNNIQDRIMSYGIESKNAPEFNIPKWIDRYGNETGSIKLKDYEEKFKVIYCFQAWCPGCHSRGLPSLKKMVDALEGNDKVVFLAIQTVFEGRHANTFEKLKEIQKEYSICIPFGHDEGDESRENISSTMRNYRTGGTPWFILIDQNNKVIFNDFHLDDNKAIEYLKELK